MGTYQYTEHDCESDHLLHCLRQTGGRSGVQVAIAIVSEYCTVHVLGCVCQTDVQTKLVGFSVAMRENHTMLSAKILTLKEVCVLCIICMYVCNYGCTYVWVCMYGMALYVILYWLMNSLDMLCTLSCEWMGDWLDDLMSHSLPWQHVLGKWEHNNFTTSSLQGGKTVMKSHIPESSRLFSYSPLEPCHTKTKAKYPTNYCM